MISTRDSLSVYKYGAKAAINCSFPTTSPILFNVAAAYFLLASILSNSPSANVVINILVKTLSYLSFKTAKRTPVNCMKVLMMFLFGSLILGFRLFIKSFMQLIVTLPKFSFTKDIMPSALYFLFCQLELSFILPISSETFCVMSTFGLFSNKFTAFFSTFFASPLNWIFGFFSSYVSNFIFFNSASILA